MDLNQIIKACKKKDAKAQRLLYEKYDARFFAVCKRYFINIHEAEDVLVKGFLKIFQHIDSFKNDGNFEGWMHRIFVNECLMELRKNKNIFLTGCMTSKSDEGKPDDQTTGTPSETKNEPGDKEEDDSESSSESKYKAENELEEKYFKIIAATEKWESFISDFTYLEQLFGDDDIEQEIYSTTRYVLEPFQLHRTYHSIYFRNDNLEIYATEDEASIKEVLKEKCWRQF